MRYLGISQIVGGMESEIVVLSRPESVVGRSPGDGLFIEDSGISRVHGLFTRQEAEWFYKDLGSTNGSFLNGTILPENVWKVMKTGDVLQLADISMKLRVLDDAGADVVYSHIVPHLLVFNGSSFLGRVEINNGSVSFGGRDADFMCRGNSDELAQLVIEDKEGVFCAYSLKSDTPVLLNSGELVGPSFVHHGDSIRVSNYTIVINDPCSVLGNPKAETFSFTPSISEPSDSSLDEEQTVVTFADERLAERFTNGGCGEKNRVFTGFGTLDSLENVEGTVTRKAIRLQSNAAWERASIERESAKALQVEESPRTVVSLIIVATLLGFPVLMVTYFTIETLLRM